MSLQNTVVFWGAGATASLKMLTTGQQGDVLYALSKKKSTTSYKECLDGFQGVFGNAFESVSDLLTLLDDDEELVSGCRMSGFSERQKKLIQKYENDLGGGDFEVARNRVIMLRLRYDWAAVMRILKVQEDDVTWNEKEEQFKPSKTFVQKVYSLIDANVSAGTGIHLLSETKAGTSDFLDATRLRAAKAALIMFINLCFAASWQVVRSTGDIEKYKKFFRLLAELRCERAKENDLCRAVFDTCIVSMNFEPIFWWFMKNADAEYNRRPLFVGAENCPLFLGEDFDHVDAVRAFQSDQGLVTDGVLRETVSDFVNLRGNLPDERCLARYQTIKIYYPHGSPNLKICPSCGKTTLYQGNALSWDSESLFPPFFLSAQTWGAHGMACVDGVDSDRGEEKKWRSGELDYIQCRHCGMGIRMCDTEMLMQSGLKALPSWVLQRVAHNIDLEILKARHIVLLGYSLPPDDALWVAELQSRKQRVHDEAFCSLVGFDRDLQDRGWLSGDDLDKYLKTENPDLYSSLKSVVAVFGKSHVRVNYRGFPDVVDSKEALRDLLYPEDWMTSVKNGSVMRQGG